MGVKGASINQVIQKRILDFFMLLPCRSLFTKSDRPLLIQYKFILRGKWIKGQITSTGGLYQVQGVAKKKEVVWEIPLFSVKEGGNLIIAPFLFK